MNHKRIRVLYTIPNFNTAGSGKSVYDLVKGLNKDIFEPEVCCFHNKGSFFEEVEALGVKIHIFPFTTDYRPYLGFLFRVLKIRNFFKAHKFDIIHSWHWSSDISEPLAAKLAGIPYVYTKKAMGWKSRFWKWRSNLSTKVIVVNEDMLTSYFSKMVKKIDKFPLAIDTKKYKPTEPSDFLKEELGILPEDFVIITVANLVEVKGIEVLIEAVKKIGDLELKILIVGDDTTPYALKLKNHYTKEKQVKFIGKQIDVRPYLAIADLFVIPTKDVGRREGIPNAPLEAMAMELVVLGTNISGIRDILKEFPDCMFKPDDVDELSRKIYYWKSVNLHEREVLGKKMRNHVIDFFSIEDFISNHERLYRNMIKR